MSYGSLLSSRFMPSFPLPGWEGTALYRPEILLAKSRGSTYYLLPWRSAVEIKPEPIDWTVVNGVKFALLEFQYTQSHLHVDPIREVGVFKCHKRETSYYEAELNHSGRSAFASATRMKYTFDDEGKMFPSQKYSDPVWEAGTLDELRSVGNFFVIQDKPQQRPEAGGAYTGHQGSLTMMLMFDEMGEVASASVKGGGEEIQYVRYYPVGIKPGALLTVAYSTGGPAHFLVLLEHLSAAITVTGVTYDMNTIDRWDDVGAAMTVMAHEQSMLPTGRLQRRGAQAPGFLSREPVTAREWPSSSRGRRWLFGLGARNDEYFIAPPRQRRDDARPRQDAGNGTTVDKPPTWATILHVDSEGASHYYETVEVSLSDGHLEKPLKDRILSMDHPVTQELNDLCAEGSLYYLLDFQPTESDDGQTKTGYYTASVGNGSLTVEISHEGHEIRGMPSGNYAFEFAPLLHNLAGFLYPVGLGEDEAKFVLLRLSGITFVSYLRRLDFEVLRSFTKKELMRWHVMKV
ncbi:hypothetical protein FOZ62_030507 [Perkinsus olseni]|uniref:Uncharacterized protein n=1 Tax=Perkinsus olseni TaxID=32597 RepID=A0A7J6S5D0_PEROL|nr:hypothetical protein FOZ62_030507 [Perkinsus olseni]